MTPNMTHIHTVLSWHEILILVLVLCFTKIIGNIGIILIGIIGMCCVSYMSPLPGAHNTIIITYMNTPLPTHPYLTLYVSIITYRVTYISHYGIVLVHVF